MRPADIITVILRTRADGNNVHLSGRLSNVFFQSFKFYHCWDLYNKSFVQIEVIWFLPFFICISFISLFLLVPSYSFMVIMSKCGGMGVLVTHSSALGSNDLR